MLYRTVPTTKDELSVLGYGCMRIQKKNGMIDAKRTEQQIRSAIDQCVNYFDTAYIYHGGASESVLGNILSKGLRNKVKLATKLPIYMVNRREDMDQFLNTQLSRLQTDHIDYYLIHNIHSRGMWEKMGAQGVFDFLDNVKKDGKILHAGFSFHGDKMLFKEIVDAYPWDYADTIQSPRYRKQGGHRRHEICSTKGSGNYHYGAVERRRLAVKFQRR